MISPELRAFAWAAAAFAASAPGAQERPDSPVSNRIDASQVSPRSGARETRVSPPGGQLRGAAPAASDQQITAREQAQRPASQLSVRQDGVRAGTQLTSERAPVTPGVQLYRGGATAQAPSPLSRPAQGRTVPGSRAIGGSDRCDAATLDAATRAACLRVIETRSAEFERDDPLVLSPEQRLLVDQRLRVGSGTVEGAAQRLGRNDVDASGIEAQSIASLTLRPADMGQTPAETAQPPVSLDAINAIVDAIVTGANGSAPVVTPPPR